MHMSAMSTFAKAFAGFAPADPRLAAGQGATN